MNQISSQKSAFSEKINFKKGLLPFVFLLAAMMLSACAPEEELPDLPEPSIAVEVTSLNQKPTYTLSEVGTVKPQEEVEIVAQASGTLDPLLVNLGDRVNQGQKLASIDVASDTTAKINLDTANSQLVNAQQGYDETIANNQDSITKVGLQIDSLESTLEQLERNLDELEENNQSTLKSLELQLENAQKSVDNAQVSRDNVESQFEQTWDGFFDSTEVSFDTIFVNANSNYQTIGDIINPNNDTIVTKNSYNRLLGVKDSQTANETINLYNQFDNRLNKSQEDYEALLPLSFDSIEPAIDVLNDLTNISRELAQSMRVFLDNSLVASNLTQITLDGYKTSIAAAETSAIADTSTINQIEQSIQSNQLQQTTQLATAENNLVIASNQVNDAQNALAQFKNTSLASTQDLEAQIVQTQNSLASAKADKTSTERSAELQKNAKLLEIDTFENQVRSAQTLLNNNEITASITGTISELSIDAGDYVNVGTMVGKIISDQQVKVIFYVTESQASQLTVGQSVWIYPPNQDEIAIEGALKTIAPSADPSNRKIKVEVVAKEPLRPEMLVRLELDVTDKTFDESKIYVQLNSIIFAQNNQYVFVAEDDRAVQKTIEVGEVIGKWAEVKSGLDENDLLIIEGHRRLEDGDLINYEFDDSDDK